MQNGGLLAITWGSEFVHYGISIGTQPLNDKFNDVSIIDVSKSSRWNSLLRTPIRDIHIYWHVLISNGFTKKYPQDIEIIFASNDKVWLGSRLYMQKRDMLLAFSDELTIIFDEETAQKYCVGRYSVPKE